METDTFFMILQLMESSKEQHLFEIEIVCNIINGFTDTFDQFNPSLLNERKKKSYWPQNYEV